MTDKSSEITDLERRVSSLTQLEHEAIAEGDDAMAEVWKKRRERVEAMLAAKGKKRGKSYARSV